MSYNGLDGLYNRIVGIVTAPTAAPSMSLTESAEHKAEQVLRICRDFDMVTKANPQPVVRNDVVVIGVPNIVRIDLAVFLMCTSLIEGHSFSSSLNATERARIAWALSDFFPRPD